MQGYMVSNLRINAKCFGIIKRNVFIAHPNFKIDFVKILSFYKYLLSLGTKFNKTLKFKKIYLVLRNLK